MKHTPYELFFGQPLRSLLVPDATLKGMINVEDLDDPNQRDEDMDDDITPNLGEDDDVNPNQVKVDLNPNQGEYKDDMNPNQGEDDDVIHGEDNDVNPNREEDEDDMDDGMNPAKGRSMTMERKRTWMIIGNPPKVRTMA